MLEIQFHCFSLQEEKTTVRLMAWQKKEPPPTYLHLYDVEYSQTSLIRASLIRMLC